MDITTHSQMKKFARTMRYIVIFPDRAVKFYSSQRKVADDISVDFTTISRKLSQENPTICTSKLNNYIFHIQKLY